MKNRIALAQSAYRQAVEALPILREHRRVAKARMKALRHDTTVTLVRWLASVDEWKGKVAELRAANENARQKLAAWKAVAGIRQKGRDRSGRGFAKVETIQRRQDKLNAERIKSEREAAFRAKEHAAKFPHANLQGAIRCLFVEVFGGVLYRITVTTDVTYTLTIEGSLGTYVTPGPSLCERDAYLRTIRQLTLLLEIPVGGVRIREGETWENVGWVVEVRPGRSPECYPLIGTNRYEDARDSFHRMTGMAADSDPSYLPQTAPLKIPG